MWSVKITNISKCIKVESECALIENTNNAMSLIRFTISQYLSSNCKTKSLARGFPLDFAHNVGNRE